MGTVTNRKTVKKNHPRFGNRQTGLLGIFFGEELCSVQQSFWELPDFLGAGTFAWLSVYYRL